MGVEWSGGVGEDGRGGGGVGKWIDGSVETNPPGNDPSGRHHEQMPSADELKTNYLEHRKSASLFDLLDWFISFGLNQIWWQRRLLIGRITGDVQTDELPPSD